LPECARLAERVAASARGASGPPTCCHPLSFREEALRQDDAQQHAEEPDDNAAHDVGEGQPVAAVADQFERLPLESGERRVPAAEARADQQIPVLVRRRDVLQNDDGRGAQNERPGDIDEQRPERKALSPRLGTETLAKDIAAVGPQRSTQHEQQHLVPQQPAQPGQRLARLGIQRSLPPPVLRPDDAPRRHRADAVERSAAGNVQRSEVLAAKGAVGHLVRWHRQEVEELPVGAEDVDTALAVLCRLERRIGLVEAPRDVKSPFAILFEPIGPAPGSPVVKQLAAFEIDRPVPWQVEAPQLASAAESVVIVVRDIEEAIVGRDEDAVGAFDLAADDAAHLAVRVDAIDPLDGAALFIADLHALAIAIARVGEVETALRVECQVVGLIVAFALEALGQDGELAVGLGARDAAQLGLAGEQTALVVKEQTVGAGPLAVDPRATIAVELVDVAVAAGEDAELRVPGRSLAAGTSAGLDLQLRTGLEDHIVGKSRMNKDQSGQ